VSVGLTASCKAFFIWSISPRSKAIALKVSTEPHGIFKAKDEIDFAYSAHLDTPDAFSSVWAVRGPRLRLRQVYLQHLRRRPLSPSTPALSTATSATTSSFLVCGGEGTAGLIRLEDGPNDIHIECDDVNPCDEIPCDEKPELDLIAMVCWAVACY
jgi:hypothetical protein